MDNFYSIPEGTETRTTGIFPYNFSYNKWKRYSSSVVDIPLCLTSPLVVPQQGEWERGPLGRIEKA